MGAIVALFFFIGVGAQTVQVTFPASVRTVAPSPMHVVGLHDKTTVTIPATAPPGSRETLMRDARGVQYRCIIPDVNQTEAPQVKEVAEDPPPPDTKQQQQQLAKAIKKKLGKGCFAKTLDYWTYEVCPFRKVTQYHKDGNTVGLSFDLGKHESGLDTLNDNQQLTQIFSGGTDGRKSLVTYVCNRSPNKDTPHLLTTVREPQERVYHFEVITPTACVPEDRRKKTQSTPLELMRPMENQCLTYSAGWWQYKFCFLRDVTQAHYEPGPTPTAPEVMTIEYMLGRLEKVVDIEQSGSIVKGDTPEETYFTQLYKDGSKCDVGSKQDRQTEVRFYCSAGTTATVKGVMETGSCVYVLTVTTGLLCSHPAFAPPAKRVHEIVCLPVSSASPLTAS